MIAFGDKHLDIHKLFLIILAMFYLKSLGFFFDL